MSIAGGGKNHEMYMRTSYLAREGSNGSIMPDHFNSRAYFRIDGTGSKFGAIDKLLVLTTAFSILISLATPLSYDLTKPGFSSYVLFEDPSFLFAYLISLFGIGALWFRQGERKLVASFLVIAFTLITVNLWSVKSPGSTLLNQSVFYGPTDTVNAASLTSYILQNGHMVYAGYGAYPATYFIGSSLAYLTGLSLTSVVFWSNTVLSGLIGILSYMIIDFFSKSHRLATAVTILSIIADENVIKQPPYTQYDYGVAFFLLMIIIMMASISSKEDSLVTSRSEIPLVLVFTASVLAYSISPFLVILIVFFSMLSKHRHISLPKFLMFAIVSFLAWSTYAALNELTALTNSLFGFAGTNNSVKLIGTNHSPAYYVLQLLSTNIGSLPYQLGYLLPIWFLGFFGIGTFAWITTKLYRRGANVPATSILAALLLTTAFVFLNEYPAGTGWDRMLVYAAPFIGATVVFVLSNRRTLFIVAIISLILLLSLPTIVAYTPDTGEISAHYPWQVDAGNYLTNYLSSGNVVFGNNVLTLNYSFNSRLISAFPTGGLTPTSERGFIMNQIGNFSLSADGSVLVVSSLFVPTYLHLYGNTYLNNITMVFDRIAESSNIIYSNSFLFILGSSSESGFQNP